MADQEQPPKEPLDVLANDSTTPDFFVDRNQLEALRKMVVDHPGSIGLLNAGAGYVKVTLHDPEGDVIDKQLLFPLYPEQ